MADIESYQAEAATAATDLEAAVAKAKSSTWLSAEGQKAKVDEAMAAYQTRVDGIKARAEADLTAQKQKIVDGLAKINAAAAKEDRDLLGPEIQYRLIERRMASATPEELVKWLDSARDPWERAVVSQIGESLLPNVGIDDGHFQAVSEFRSRLQTAADPTIVKLQAALSHADYGLSSLERLDPLGHTWELYQRLGLNNAIRTLPGPYGQ